MAFETLTIREVGAQGDGIAYSRLGKVLIEHTAPGDRVSVKIHRDDSGLLRGSIIKIVQPSPYRTKAPCPHFAQCGQCTVQHLIDPFYRDWKTSIVKTALQKRGILPRHWVAPVFVGPYSRRRLTFTATQNFGKKLTLGYYKRRSQLVTDIEVCEVSQPILLDLQKKLRSYLPKMLFKKNRVDIFLQNVSGQVDMVLTGSIGLKDEPNHHTHDLLLDFVKNTPIHRIVWQDTNRRKMITLVERDLITATFGKLKVLLPPGAFLQPTQGGEAALVKSIVSQLHNGERYADLFSGCGTFSGPMLNVGAHVDSFENNHMNVLALSNTNSNHKLNVFERDLFRHPLNRKELNRYGAIVFDPPRSGSIEQVNHIANSKVPIIVGVSCNPLTFSRDAKILCEGGYSLERIQVIDQFHWSHHVELVSLFTRKQKPFTRI